LNKNPEDIVSEMMTHDAFSHWLGIEVLEISEGKSVLRMKIRDEMTNGFGIAHGGIVFSLADSAIAFAANSYGIKSVTLEATIAWPNASRSGDVLTAKAINLSLGNRTAVFDVNITNQNEEMVGLFRATVYRTSKKW
jgi:acyl-CoA thioesterase